MEQQRYREGMTPLRMVQKPPFSIEVEGAEPVPGETIPRRHPKARDGLLTRPAPDVDTVFALLRHSAKEYAGEPAVGSRRFVQTHRERKKVTKLVDGEPQQVEKEWTYLELSGYEYLSYAQFYDLVLQVGSGLRKLGLGSDDKLHIFATTRFVATGSLFVGCAGCEVEAASLPVPSYRILNYQYLIPTCLYLTPWTHRYLVLRSSIQRLYLALVRKHLAISSPLANT